MSHHALLEIGVQLILLLFIGRAVNPILSTTDPISITSVLSKIFEHFISNNIFTITWNNMISSLKTNMETDLNMVVMHSYWKQ